MIRKSLVIAMKNLTRLLALCASVLPNPALAADPAAPVPRHESFPEFWERFQNSPEQISGDRISIRPGSPYYSASLAEQGVQGTVILLLDLSKTGEVTGARVHTSSHSGALDASAIRKAMTMSYAGRGAPPATVSLKVEFRRDRPDALSAKSCREFNVDVAWFRNAFPGRPETEMPAIIAVGNMVRIGYGSRDRWEREPVLEAIPFAQCAVVPGCAANPDESVGNVFNRAMREHIADPKAHEALCAFATPQANDDDGLPRSLLHVDLDEPVRARDQYITPEMPAYPPQLVASGVQGRVTVEVTLTRQGQIRDIRAEPNQSGAAPLADAAVAYVRRLPLSRAARAEAPETIVIVPVEFRKDTKASIGGKTCADFNIDVRAYKAAHAAADLQAMNVVSVAKSVVLDHAMSGTADHDQWQISTTEEDVQRLAKLCIEQPEANFMDMFLQQGRSKKP